MGTGGGGGIQSVVAGAGISVDNTDPLNPVVASTVAAPNLQAVTTAGNITSDNIILDNGGADAFFQVKNSPAYTLPFISVGGGIGDGGVIVFADADTYTSTIGTSGLTANRTIDFPNASGTIALTSDIPAAGVTTMAAIGVTANANGATIAGTVLNLQPASASFGGVISMTTQTMGGGNKTFAGTIGLNGTAASSSYFINGSTSSTGFARIYLTNTSNGNGAGVGALYTNDVGGDLQYYQGSSTNLYIADGAYIHSSGTNGFRFVTSGIGAKVRWSTSNTVGLETAMYMRWDNASMLHTGIPALTTENRLLAYVNSTGEFSKITVGTGLTLTGGELDAAEVYFSNRFGGDGSIGDPITPIKVTTTASSATPTPDADASTIFTVTALAANAVFAAPTGTPVDGQDLLIRIKDNATPRTLGWNAIYRAGTDFALPTTTVASETIYVQFIYNAADATWDAIGLTQGFA